MTLKALIFDVDGTLAETEDYHRIAFNLAFKDFGIDWQWNKSQYGELLKTTGGKERIARYAKEVDYGNIDVATLHARKNDFYSQLITDGKIELRSGVADLIEHAKNIRLGLAIATTTSRANVNNLLHATLGPASLDWFDAICCGDEVKNKKPDPAIYQLALDRLGLPASQCLAFEDSHMGLMSALGAGLPVIVTPGIYTRSGDFSRATLLLENLSAPFSYLNLSAL
jgi:HAD superfamily hydrolase (TIGR01509 family)